MNLIDEFIEILFISPGGGASMLTSAYYRHAKVVFEFAMQSFATGSHFPVWGTCLGFETLMVLVAGDDKSILGSCDTNDVSLALDFTPHAASSRMFEGASSELMSIMGKQEVTYNHHKHCITNATYQSDARLKNFFDVLAFNTDPEGVAFVSTVEGEQDYDKIL